MAIHTETETFTYKYILNLYIQKFYSMFMCVMSTMNNVRTD